MSDFEVMPPGSGRVLRQALQQLERGFAGRNHLEQKPQYTTGHCKERAKPNGCGLHNLQCGYPECDRKPAALAHREQEPGVCGRCGGLVYDPVVVQQKQEPVAWRFRTIGIEHAAWRLTDDAGLVEQMRKLGHWDIRPLGELADEGGGK